MKCTKCGKEFEAGTRPDGLPNGAGYELEDGQMINFCTDCILQTITEELGKQVEEK